MFDQSILNLQQVSDNYQSANRRFVLFRPPLGTGSDLTADAAARLACEIHFIEAASEDCDFALADFILAPFDPQGQYQLWHACYRLSGNFRELCPEILQRSEQLLKDNRNQVLTRPVRTAAETKQDPVQTPNTPAALNSAIKERYARDFACCKAALDSGRLQKIVLSRPCYQRPERPLAAIFADLLTHYPQAFCFLLHAGDGLFLLGATPETLVHFTQGKLNTMALAGTMACPAGIDATSLHWSQKDQKEQNLVTDFILNALKPFTDTLSASAPLSVQAGPVAHLKSKISATLKPGITELQVVRALHPTPAVCGLPAAAALDFIQNHEQGQRNYYAGFLGYREEGLHLFVNLRSLSFKDGIACLRAGGGLLPESVLDSEWQETENKLSTLRALL